MSDEELTKAMEGLGMDEGDGEGNILPIMQSIMQNLLSKDVLYPSLKEITEKVCELPFLLFLFIFHHIRSCGLFCLLRACRKSNLSLLFFLYLFEAGRGRGWGELCL